jgi:RNA polymerase sigma-70 factor (ECF subfamily)
MAPPHRSDEESTARLERLLERYAALLRGQIAQHCPRRLGIQIDDIEQEARLRLWKALQREKELHDPASYIYRVAVTTTIDAVRGVLARREEQMQVDDESEEPPEDFVADPIGAPDAVTERRRWMSAIATALATLSESRRQAVQLHLQGLTVPEIAELLQWSEARARNLVYRGMQDLREALRREGIESP